MSAALDILTPAGQQTVAQELIAYAIFEACQPGYTIKHTDKAEPEPYDGWIMHAGKPVALSKGTTSENLFTQLRDSEISTMKLMYSSVKPSARSKPGSTLCRVRSRR